MELFNLEIITQDSVLFKGNVESLTAPASEGEVTILAHHAPFFSKINPGQITVKKGREVTQIVTGSGFIDVSLDNKVTILADNAIRADDIDIARAEEARRKAEELLLEKERLSKTEILRVEASLRKAVLELKVGRRKKQSKFQQTPSQFS